MIALPTFFRPAPHRIVEEHPRRWRYAINWRAPLNWIDERCNWRLALSLIALAAVWPCLVLWVAFLLRVW